MKPIQTSIILALGLLASDGCSSWQSMCPDFVKLSPADSLQYSNCPQAQSASTDKAARLAALETERQRGVPRTVALR
jgi:hypothetical protein